MIFAIGFLNKLGMGSIVTTCGSLAICVPFQVCWKAIKMIWTLIQSIGFCKSLCTTCGNCCTKLSCLKAPFLGLFSNLKYLLLSLSSKLGGKAKDTVNKRGKVANTVTTTTTGIFGFAKNAVNTMFNVTKNVGGYIADKTKAVKNKVLSKIKKGKGNGDDGHEAEVGSMKNENKEKHEVVDELKNDIDSRDLKGNTGELFARDNSLDDNKTLSDVVNKPIQEENLGSLLDYVNKIPPKPQLDKEKRVEDEDDEAIGSLPKFVSKRPSKPQLDDGEEIEEVESSSKPTYSTQGKKKRKKKKTRHNDDTEQLTSVNTPQQAINANLFQVQQPFNNGLMIQDPNMMSIYDPQQLYSSGVAQTMPGLYNSNPMLVQFPNATPRDQLALYDPNIYPTTNMNSMPFQNQMQGGLTMYANDPLMQLPPPMSFNYDMNMPPTYPSNVLAQQQYTNPTTMYDNVAYNNPLYGTIGPQGAQSLPPSNYELPTSYPQAMVQQPLPLTQDTTMYNNQIPYVAL